MVFFFSGVNISPNFWNSSRQPQKLFPSPLSFVRENHAEPLQKLCLWNIFEGLIENFVKNMTNLANSAILLAFKSKNSSQGGQFFKTFKTAFFRDTLNSSNWVPQIGLKMTQDFFFGNYLKNNGGYSCSKLIFDSHLYTVIFKELI